MKPKLAPVEIIMDKVMKCTKCGAGVGGCDCWTKCNHPNCAWFYEKGKHCENQMHQTDSKLPSSDNALKSK